MFTGLIEAVGRVERVPDGTGVLAVACPFAGEVRIGDSIAVDGACLTAVNAGKETLEFDLSPETVRCCVEFVVGSHANLERALLVTSRISGHFVTGHVNGTATVAQIVEEGGSRRMRLKYRADEMAHIASKGCVALAGVSLTVCGVFDDGFDVQVVPHTLRSTTLGAARTGSRINIETDLLARYVGSLWAVG